MMTPREKMRIILMFSGIALGACGGAVACAEPEKGVEVPRHRVGAWKDGGIAGAVSKDLAPWMITAGAIMLGVSFVSKD